MTTRLTALLMLLAIVGCGRPMGSNNTKPASENISNISKDTIDGRSIFNLKAIPPAIPDDDLKAITAADRKTAVLLSSLDYLSKLEKRSRLELESGIGFAYPHRDIALQTEVNWLVDVDVAIDQIREDIYKHSEYKEPNLSEIRHDELDHASLNARIRQVITSLGKIKAAIAQLDESERESKRERR